MKRLSDYTYHALQKKSYEHILFIVIIAVFSLGILGNVSYTGKVTGDTNYESYSIDTLFIENSNYTLLLKGDVTSIRASGEFIGNGTGKIYANGILVVDSGDLDARDALITGFAVSDIVDLEPSNDSVQDNIGNNSEIVEPIVENITEIDLEEINLTEVPEEILVPVNDSDEFGLNSSFNNNESLTMNETVPAVYNLSFEGNETESEEELIEDEITDEITTEKKYFSNYCLDSCSLNLPGEVILVIELENMWLNLSDIVYGYEEYIEDSNETDVIVDGLINVSLDDSLNLTGLNESLISNYSLNATNETLTNLSIVNITGLNISSNVSLNLSFQNITYFENVTEIFNVSEQLTRQLNLTIFEENEEFITAGIDLNNYVRLQKGPDFYAAIYSSTDRRINSKIILVENISFAEIVLEGDANTVLKCEQFDGYCKKWKKTQIGFESLNKSIKFSVNESGIYGTADIIYGEPGKIESTAVYLNSDCEYCEIKNNCNAERFCVSQNTGMHKTEFTAQLGFDILSINSNVKNAQVCALKYYADEPSFNYIKYSDESHCSIEFKNSTSDIISYKFSKAENGFICIDATEIINYAIGNKESNVFINWLGQDLNGESFPLSCFYGNATDCGNENCKPYVRLEYD